MHPPPIPPSLCPDPPPPHILKAYTRLAQVGRRSIVFSPESHVLSSGRYIVVSGSHILTRRQPLNAPKLTDTLHCIALSDSFLQVHGGICLSLSGSRTILKSGHCRAYSGSVVTMYGGTCEAYSGSIVIVYGGRCIAHDGAVIILYGGTCDAYKGSRITIHGGVCRANRFSRIALYSGYCRAGPDSSVTIHASYSPTSQPLYRCDPLPGSHITYN